MSALKSTSSFPSLPSPTSPINLKKPSSSSIIFLSLPPPLLLHILSFLSLSDVLGPVILTCRRLKLLASHTELFESKLAILGHPHYSKRTLPTHVQDLWVHFMTLDKNVAPKEVYKQVHQRLYPHYIKFRASTWKQGPFWKEFKDKSVPAQYLALFNAFGKTLNLKDQNEIQANFEEGFQLFESECLQAFDQSHQVNNEQEMRMLANALYFLNGGQTCLQLYIFKLPIFFDRNEDVTRNFIALSIDGEDQSPLAIYLNELSMTLQEYLPKIAMIFPHASLFQYTFVQKVFEECISDYLQRLLKEAQQRNYKLFLQTLTRMFIHCSKLIVSLATMLETKKLEKLLDTSLHGFVEQYMELETHNFTNESVQLFKQWQWHPSSLAELLNLELVMTCIEYNREAIKRCIVMMQRKGPIQPHIESLFALLLEILGQYHVQPSFSKATEMLAKYDSKLALNDCNQDVVSFSSFFALIKLGDQVLTSVQTYFANDIVLYLNSMDTLSVSSQAQKRFECLFDDGLAHGLDQAMVTLLQHAQLLLQTFQLGTDFEPLTKSVPLTPTLACTNTLACLRHHINALNQVAEKSMVSIFIAELGTRFFQVLCQHIKKMRINVQGGFRLMSDVNEYHRWATSLAIEEVENYYIALKSTVNVFVVTDIDGLKSLVKDHERYRGVFHVEEIYEFIKRRSDYDKIERRVKESECCIM